VKERHDAVARELVDEALEALDALGEDREEALHDATRNFLRGTQLKEAVAALSKGAEAVPAGAPSATETPKPPSR